MGALTSKEQVDGDAETRHLPSVDSRRVRLS
jgi:hypothetical protein